MIFLDTTYLVALACPDDSLHGRARAWSQVVVPPLLTTDYVILEVVNYLSEPTHRRGVAHAVTQWLRTSRDVRLVQASDSLLEQGLHLHAERPDKFWSLTDCISFVVMEREGVRQALTHDHHFEQAGFEALLRRDPP